MIRRTLKVAVECDQCERALGQGYGYTETFDTEQQAAEFAKACNWTAHPDGRWYCPEGKHQ